MNRIKSIASFALAAAVLLSAMHISAAAAKSASFSYFAQLSANQKAVYRAVAEMDPYVDEQLIIELPEPITYRSDASGESKRAEREFTAVVQGALDAFLFDHPEILWLDKSRCSTSADAETTSSDGDRYTWEIGTIQLNCAIVPGGVKLGLAVQQALFEAQGQTRYEQLLDIHDRLCSMTEYVSGGNEHNAYGALVQGQAVCEGYAKAFKLLCDKAGIPCVLVAGRGQTARAETQNHMWNYVQMEDGKWYAVDATWDDQGQTIYRDFFLCGSGDVSSEGFGSTPFSESHIPNGDFSNSGIVFEYPPLSASRYRAAA